MPIEARIWHQIGYLVVGIIGSCELPALGVGNLNLIPWAISPATRRNFSRIGAKHLSTSLFHRRLLANTRPRCFISSPTLEATFVITMTKYSKEAIFKRNDSPFQDVTHYDMPQELAHTWGNYEAKARQRPEAEWGYNHQGLQPRDLFSPARSPSQPQKIALDLGTFILKKMSLLQVPYVQTIAVWYFLIFL